MEDNAVRALPSGEKRKDHSLIFCFFYLIGVILGYRLFDRIFVLEPAAIGRADLIALLAFSFVPVLLLIFFSTSTVGWFAIPVVFLSKGFSVSTDVSVLLRYGVGIAKTGLIVAFPNLLFLGALLYLGETSAEKSLILRSNDRFYADFCPVQSDKGKLTAAAILVYLSAMIKSGIYRFLTE